jgi:hypothetical protein
MPYGCINVTLVNGRGLRDKDLFGRNDAYANFQLAAGTILRLALFAAALEAC